MSDLKFNVEVIVQGRPNSGKTTVAMVIEHALRAYGFEVEADLRFMDYENGEKVADLGTQQFEEKKERIFTQDFKSRFIPRRKITIKQRAKARSEVNIGSGT